MSASRPNTRTGTGSKNRRRPQRSREERICSILETLRSDHEIRVSELVSKLGVSEVTIRKDLEFVKQVVPLIEVRGGARAGKYIDPYLNTYYAYRRGHATDAKAVVAGYAVDYLIPAVGKEVLLLDGGTSVEAFVSDLKAKQRTGVRGVSHSAVLGTTFLGMIGNCEYVQIGGFLNERTVAYLDNSGGVWSERDGDDGPMMRSLRHFLEMNPYGNNFTAVLSASGINLKHGIGVNTAGVVPYKRALIQNASRIIILLDHTKFGQDTGISVAYCGLREEHGNWLDEEKEAIILLDSRFEDSKQEQTYRDFARLSQGAQILQIAAPYKERIIGLRVRLRPGASPPAE